MAIPKVTIPPSVSVQSIPEVKLHAPHFPVCEPGVREAQIISTLSTGRIIPQFRYSRLMVR